jgi:hypothetical protein
MAAPRRTVDSEAEGSAETVHRAIGIELGHLGGVVNMKVSAGFRLPTPTHPALWQSLMEEEQQHGIRSRRDLGGDFGEMEGHRLGVATWHDQGPRLCRPWDRSRRRYKLRRLAGLWERLDARRAWPNGG